MSPVAELNTPQEPADISGPISVEEYMRVLAARQAAFVAAQSSPTLRYPPLLKWFIRDEDAAHVVLPESAPSPKHVPTPRVYRSAESIRAELEKVTAQRDAIGANDPTDPAAVNISPFSRNKAVARAGRARFARMDRDLERYTRLTQRRDQLAGRLAVAEAREKEAAAADVEVVSSSPESTQGGTG